MAATWNCGTVEHGEDSKKSCSLYAWLVILDYFFAVVGMLRGRRRTVPGFRTSAWLYARVYTTALQKRLSRCSLMPTVRNDVSAHLRMCTD